MDEEIIIVDSEIEPYRVYVQTDEQNRIIATNSSEFVDAEWGVEIDAGYEYKYHHAQGNYFPTPIYTDDGIPRYKLLDRWEELTFGERTAERTDEEIEADRASLPQPVAQPTVEELNAKIAALTASNQFLEDCIVEMAGVVYA